MTLLPPVGYGIGVNHRRNPVILKGWEKWGAK